MVFAIRRPLVLAACQLDEGYFVTRCFPHGLVVAGTLAPRYEGVRTRMVAQRVSNGAVDRMPADERRCGFEWACGARHLLEHAGNHLVHIIARSIAKIEDRAEMLGSNHEA